MGGDRELETVSAVTEELGSTPAIHIDTHDEVIPPTLPTIHRNEPNGPTLFSSRVFNPGMASVNNYADEDVINATPLTSSLIHFVLGNFFLAMFSISLILSITFFAVAWFTVLRNTRLMKDQVLHDVNGVSLYICYNKWVLTTAVIVVGFSTWPWPSTRPGCMRIVHFMEGYGLWCAHRFPGWTLG